MTINKKLNKTITIALALSFALSIFLSPVSAQKASAQEDVAIITGEAMVSVPVFNLSQSLQTAKELKYDAVAKIAIKIFIKSLVQKVVNWIKQGVNGEPMTIKNFGDLFLEAGNEASSSILRDINAEWLCKDLRPQLDAVFRRNTAPQIKMGCTINDVVDNIEDFHNDFSNGGWKAWLKISMEPQNNPYGAFITTQEQFEKYLAQKQQEKQLVAQTGNGFLGIKKCVSYDPECFEEDVSKCCLRFEIQSPGVVVQDYLSQYLGTEIKQLELADEFDDLIVFFTQKAVGYIGNELMEGGGSNGISSAGSTPGQISPSDFKWKPDTAALNQQRRTIRDKTTLLYENVVADGSYLELLTATRKMLSDSLENLNILIDKCPAIKDIGIKVDYKIRRQDIEKSIKTVDKKISNAQKYADKVSAFYEDIKSKPDSALDDDAVYGEKGWNNKLTELQSEFDGARTSLNQIQQDREALCAKLENADGEGTSCGVCSDLDGAEYPMVLPAADCRMITYAATKKGNRFWNPQAFTSQQQDKRLVVGYRSIYGLDILTLNKDFNGLFGIYDKALGKTADEEDLFSQQLGSPEIYKYLQSFGIWQTEYDEQQIKAICDNDPKLSLRPGETYYANVFNYYFHSSLSFVPAGILKNYEDVNVGEIGVFECDKLPPVCSGKPWPKVTQMADDTASETKYNCTFAEGAGSNGQDQLDLSKVTVIGDNNHEAINWPITSPLNYLRIDGTRISFNTQRMVSEPGMWKNNDVGTNGNPWVFAKIDGKWYGGVWEWLREGTTEKQISTQEIGEYIKASPMKEWSPAVGEEVGFMISSIARTPSKPNNHNVEERTNVVMLKWPTCVPVQ